MTDTVKSLGIDIGSTTTKAVLLEDSTIKDLKIIPTGNVPGESAEELFKQIIEANGYEREQISVVSATGYGRRLVSFSDIIMTEIKACVAGVLFWQYPSKVRTIIDVGGQDTKVISLSDDGDIEDFSMNDKCAAGTGRFLEVLANKLSLSYEEFAAEASKSDMLIQMRSTCAVFAESEDVGLLAKKVSKANISAAAHDSIAARIASMVRRVGRRGAYCFVGGGAGNPALVSAIEENLNDKVFIPEHHQAIIALGAAIEGRRKYLKATKK